MGYIQKTITLTDDQCQYLRDNYRKMSQAEMARKLKISIHRVQNHITLLGLLRRVRQTALIEPVMEGYFNEQEYKKTILYQ